jgi:transcription initiation factor TFIID subunit 6
LQLYFDKVTELALNEPDSVLFKEALVSLATDSGLHPLVPYFTCFVADEVTRCLFLVLVDKNERVALR